MIYDNNTLDENTSGKQTEIYIYKNSTYGYTFSQLREICLSSNCFGIYDRNHFYTMPCDDRDKESEELLNAFEDWKVKLMKLTEILKRKNLDFYLVPNDYPFSPEQHDYLKNTIFGHTSIILSKSTESSEEMIPEVITATTPAVPDINSISSIKKTIVNINVSASN